jgi:hypothetical protein
MQTDGMWTGEFATTEGNFGGGVIFFTGHKVFGGDSGYTYAGDINFAGKPEHEELKAKLRIEPFIDGYESIFRTTGRGYTLELIGRFLNTDVIVGHGFSPDFPDVRLSMRLSRRKSS